MERVYPVWGEWSSGRDLERMKFDWNHSGIIPYSLYLQPFHSLRFFSRPYRFCLSPHNSQSRRRFTVHAPLMTTDGIRGRNCQRARTVQNHPQTRGTARDWSHPLFWRRGESVMAANGLCFWFIGLWLSVMGVDNRESRSGKTRPQVTPPLQGDEAAEGNRRPLGAG